MKICFFLMFTLFSLLKRAETRKFLFDLRNYSNDVISAIDYKAISGLETPRRRKKYIGIMTDNYARYFWITTFYSR